MSKIKIKIAKDPMEIELDKCLNRMIKESRLNQNRIVSLDELGFSEDEISNEANQESKDMFKEYQENN